MLCVKYIETAQAEKADFKVAGQSNEIQFPGTKRRSLEVSETDPVEVVVNANKEPPITSFTDESIPGESLQGCICAINYLLWIILRKLNMADRTLSTYSGWRTCVKNLNSTTALKKTVLEYLPPPPTSISANVPEFSMIYQYLTYLQFLASEVNMPCMLCKRDIGRWCCHGCRKGVVELPFEIQKRYYSFR